MTRAVIAPITQMRKLRPRPAKTFTQGATARKQRSRDLNPGLPVARARALTSICGTSSESLAQGKSSQTLPGCGHSWDPPPMSLHPKTTPAPSCCGFQSGFLWAGVTMASPTPSLGPCRLGATHRCLPGDLNPGNLRSQKHPQWGLRQGFCKPTLRRRLTQCWHSAGAYDRGRRWWAVSYYSDSTSLASWIQSNSCPERGRARDGHTVTSVSKPGFQTPDFPGSTPRPSTTCPRGQG